MEGGSLTPNSSASDLTYTPVSIAIIVAIVVTLAMAIIIITACCWWKKRRSGKEIAQSPA